MVSTTIKDRESQVVKRKFPPGERWRITRNIVVLGAAFMVHFTAFHGAANLQSSVHAGASLGTMTLAAIYGSLILSNIILPVTVIGWLGCKWTVAISFVAYMPFIGAQFYPRAYTLLPAGLMVGLGGGPLWCAKCTYLTVAAEAYSEITNLPTDMLVTRFFGLFFMFYQMAQVWGNLISSAVLSSDFSMSDLIATSSPTNGTYNSTSFLAVVKSIADESTNTTADLLKINKIHETCGANFCHEVATEVNPNLDPPSAEKIQLIAGIYLACMVAAALSVAIGVDSLKRYSGSRVGPTGSAISRLLATLKQTKEPYQLLLLPATVFIGAEQAFMAADYSASFVACAWGIRNIGFVMICFGVFNAIAAMAAGGIVKITGRYPVMIIALILHLGIIVSLLQWRPSPEEPSMFFIMAALWGTADAVWLVQVNALSGILFPGKEEASYSNFRLWEATGSVMAYAASPYLCTSSKLLVLIGLLVLGMAGYAIIEMLEFKVKRGANLKRDFELVDEKRQTPVIVVSEELY